MKTSLLLLVAVAALWPSTVAAQRPTGVELGASLGATIAINGDTEVAVGLPTPGAIGTPAVYFTWFAGGGLMVEPQLGVAYNNTSRQVVLNSNLQVGYFLTPNLYVAANGGYARFGTFVTSGTVGGGFGYRTVVMEHLAIRGEARYRRWLASGGFNEITLSIGFGTALP
jgi:hypothetical protein